MACEIDYAALGTWAAVVVALGIAVADKVSAYFRRKRESKILAILVLEELGATAVRLEQLSELINPQDAPLDWYEMLLVTNHGTREELKVAGDRLKIPVIESVIERLPNINQALGIGLVRTLAAIQAIKVGCNDPVKTPANEHMPDSQEFIQNLRGEVANALTITHSTLKVCGSLSIK